MGFTLKKILSAFLMPLSIGLIIVAIGLFYLYIQSYKKAKFYLTVGFIWIVLISYAPFSNALLEPLEKTYEPIKVEQHNAKYILLLGGDFQARAYEAIRLHHLIHDSTIITSGYPGLGKKISEAVKNANKLMELGIKKEHILMQTKPRDTQEEAQYIKRLIGQQSFILVTSAYHMPRAMMAFEQEGLSPIPAPTNFLIKPASGLSHPNGLTLSNTERAWHEYLGTWWYELKQLVK